MISVIDLGLWGIFRKRNFRSGKDKDKNNLHYFTIFIHLQSPRMMGTYDGT